MPAPVPRMRASLDGVRPYARLGDLPLDLSDNSNRWGAAPSALEAFRGAGANVARYPEPYAETLKVAIGAYLGVDRSKVTTGCGSNGVLDAAIRAFADAGDRIAIAEPTFPMPRAMALMHALEPVSVPLTADYQPDTETIADSGARIVYLCSPSNPFGVVSDQRRILALAAATDALVIVDEAYAEFSGQTLVPFTRELANLLVVRTMSKAFGLAGARVGYAVGSPRIIEPIERSRGPFMVNAGGAAAAAAALRWDVGWMRARVALAIAERRRLARMLRDLGLDPLPSAANFLLVPVPDAAAVAGRLRARDVAVRAFDGLLPVSPALQATKGQALRITVGPRAEMDVVAATLAVVLREQAPA